uniref:Uncharacterized protein n=1 Tax=Coccidioides posadasii RMSCC 3488 TaxID=454284 RepID=A0A0J6INR5_COCPO|nr:hypothetical protein CPAG_09864 [Coccidioides posadasii RMSCC 3488]
MAELQCLGDGIQIFQGHVQDSNREITIPGSEDQIDQALEFISPNRKPDIPSYNVETQAVSKTTTQKEKAPGDNAQQPL